MRRLSPIHLLLFTLLFIAGVPSIVSAHQESSNSLLVSTLRSDIIAQSNQAGALTWTASYEAFGTRPVEYGSNADRQRANTKEEDPTGLLWEHFRYRDLETGVWLSRDPAGFVDGPNLYAYVSQNPWSKFDPQGLWIEDVAIGVPSLVIGVKSAFDNFRAGNIGAGALDTAGAIVDIAAIIAPGIPGGAGLAIKAARYGEKAMDVVNTATTAVEVGQSLSEGDYGGAALAAATGGIGTPGRGKKSHQEHNGMVASSHGGGAHAHGDTPGGSITKADSVTESARNVSRAEGTYGELRSAGAKDGHHVIQHAAVRDLPGYDRNAAPAIQLEGLSTRVGSEHYKATQSQRRAGGGTYGDERKSGYRALRESGISRGESRRQIERADKYFGDLGVNRDTPTRIPKNRKKN